MDSLGCSGLSVTLETPSLDRLDLELKDHEGSTALWLALQYITVSSDASVNPFEDDAPVVNGTSFDENSFAAQLIQRGSNADSPDSATGAACLFILFYFLLLFKLTVTLCFLGCVSITACVSSVPRRTLSDAEGDSGGQ